MTSWLSLTSPTCSSNCGVAVYLTRFSRQQSFRRANPIGLDEPNSREDFTRLCGRDQPDDCYSGACALRPPSWPAGPRARAEAEPEISTTFRECPKISGRELGRLGNSRSEMSSPAIYLVP